MDGHPYVIDDYFGRKGILSILTILIIHENMIYFDNAATTYVDKDILENSAKDIETKVSLFDSVGRKM